MGLTLGGPREILVVGGPKFLGGPSNSGGTWKAEGHHGGSETMYYIVDKYIRGVFLIEPSPPGNQFASRTV